MPSTILASFGPDIHVFREKNQIFHIFPCLRGSPGQSLFLRFEKEKRTESGIDGMGFSVGVVSPRDFCVFKQSQGMG